MQKKREDKQEEKAKNNDLKIDSAAKFKKYQEWFKEHEVEKKTNTPKKEEKKNPKEKKKQKG